MNRWLVAAGAPLLASTPWLLNRMRRDLEQHRRLQVSTAAWMWSCYTAHAGLTVAALATPPARRRLSPLVGATATAAALTGAVVDVASMRRFAGPAQLTGTTAGNLVTGGIYRHSRNPQYLGTLIGLTGLAVLRRSPAALALTAALATVYRVWVPREEQHLARQFGQPYLLYRAATARWLGPARNTEDRRQERPR